MDTNTTSAADRRAGRLLAAPGDVRAGRDTPSDVVPPPIGHGEGTPRGSPVDDPSGASTDVAASPWAPSIPRRAALAAVVLAVVALGIAVPRAVFGQADAEALPQHVPAEAASGAPLAPGPAVTGAGAPAGSASPVAAAAAQDAEVFVHVVGQVRRPGVVRVAAGSRVAAALREAGGATRRADLAALNLARPVVDGEQLFVPRPGESPPAVPGSAPGSGGGPALAGGPSAGPSGALVDLNTATEAELDTLPGVGPVIAGRIIEWRQQQGRFTSVEELAEVSGIGDATLERLRPLVKV